MAEDSLAEIEYGAEPPVIVVGGDEAARERGARTALLAGCRVAASSGPGGTAARLEGLPAAYPMLIELGEEADGGALALLDRAQAEAEIQGRPSVIVAPPALIDLVAARTHHPLIEHLCDAREPERVAALAKAAGPRPIRLHDIGRDNGALLLQLSEEMGRIAGILASLTDAEAAESAEARKPRRGREAEEEPVDPAYIRGMIRARRLRERYLRGDLFADPAWDMMLDLMAARLERKKVAVSSLCIAAAVPPTTALRWIKALTDRGLFVRCADPRDGRRVYIELSDDTARSLGACLRALQRIDAKAV